MKSRIFVLIMAVIFLLTQIGCATLNTSRMQTNTPYPDGTMADQGAQWKKEEKEWWFVVLIVLGVAAVLGATIAISSGGGGFSAGINN
jgi:hypothetical protein